MTEEEAIERIKDLIHTCEVGIEKHGEYDDLFHKDKEALERVLNLIEKQDNRIKELEKALKKKDKIIDAMSDTIETSQYANIDNTDLSEICCYLKCKKECNDVKKECIKEYFEKKEV